MELKFVAPSSFIGPKFWEELYKKKMNEFKLDDSEKVLTGYYSLLEGIVRFESASLSTSHSLSFDKNHSLRSGSFINLNTVNVRLKLEPSLSSNMIVIEYLYYMI